MAPRECVEHNDDEERLLVASQAPSQRKVKLPKVQLTVLLLAFFAQPVATTFIYPFVAKVSILLSCQLTIYLTKTAACF